MFEHFKQPLLPGKAFFKRVLYCSLLSLALLGITITIGTAGFYFIESLPLIDSFLDAVLVMTGVGMVSDLVYSAGKFFTAVYSILSNFMFYSIIAILISPFIHRLIHRLNLDTDKR